MRGRQGCEFYLNGELQNEKQTEKITKVIDMFRENKKEYVKVVSVNNMQRRKRGCLLVRVWGFRLWFWPVMNILDAGTRKRSLVKRRNLRRGRRAEVSLDRWLGRKRRGMYTESTQN